MFPTLSEKLSRDEVQGVSVAADSLAAGVGRRRVGAFACWTQGLLRRSRLARLDSKSEDEDEVRDVASVRSLVL